MSLRQRSPRNWLLKLYPPERWYPGEIKGETLLWWRTIRQAAWDISYGSETQALDAWEFLRSTGLWLLIEIFNVPEAEAIRTLASIVKGTSTWEWYEKETGS